MSLTDNCLAKLTFSMLHKFNICAPWTPLFN